MRANLAHIMTAVAAGIVAVVSAALEPVTPEEAIALVRFHANDVVGASATPTDDQARRYVARARDGKGDIVAEVDAIAARVLSIRRGSETVYVWPGVVAVGHRGTVKFAPENTIAAFVKAVELGADLVEMDVRQTKDGELVIMHDGNIARTTTGRGNVGEMTLAEIKSYDAGEKFNTRFRGEKAPAFAEAVNAVKGRALPDIDFKSGDPQKLVDAVRAAGLAGKCTLYCGDWEKLKQVLAIEPGFLIRPTAPKGLEGLDTVLKAFDPPIVNIDWQYFSEELVRKIHLAGKRAFVNTMGKEDGEAAMLRAVEAGADYFQTDHLDVLLPLLRARNLHR